jgi:hypothetical protein
VLEKGSLRKQSYVRLEHTYNVPVSTLVQYTWNRCRAYKIRLSNSSYNNLMKELGLLPEPFEETATLESRRLSELANPLRRAPVLIPVRAVADLPPSTRSQQVCQHSQSNVSHPMIPAARYGTVSSTQTPRYLSLPHSYTPDYSSSSESPGDTCPLFFKYLLGVLVVGSLVCWSSYN